MLLDLDNGGTLTIYLDGKPCGTIAEGLEGPVYPCIASYYKGKAVKIHSGLAPPPPQYKAQFYIIKPSENVCV